MAWPPPLRRWWLRRRHGGGPWAALLAPPPAGELVVLDLETTGLDPATDHILSLAAVPLRGGVLRVSERFTRRVRPGRDFGLDSIRHHGILPAEAAGGAPVRAALREFLAWLGPRDLLGHRLDFDLAMLAPHVRAITGFDLPNRRLDLAERWARRSRRRQPELPVDTGFDHIAGRLGVPVLDRHSALGDAVTTGACWLAMDAG